MSFTFMKIYSVCAMVIYSMFTEFEFNRMQHLNAIVVILRCKNTKNKLKISQKTLISNSQSNIFTITMLSLQSICSEGGRKKRKKRKIKNLYFLVVKILKGDKQGVIQ